MHRHGHHVRTRDSKEKLGERRKGGHLCQLGRQLRGRTERRRAHLLRIPNHAPITTGAGAVPVRLRLGGASGRLRCHRCILGVHLLEDSVEGGAASGLVLGGTLLLVGLQLLQRQPRRRRIHALASQRAS